MSRRILQRCECDQTNIPDGVARVFALSSVCGYYGRFLPKVTRPSGLLSVNATKCKL
jgi:hypothetical protein